MQTDFRHITTGLEIPSEGYCDQPYVVVNSDGSWTCVMTTGKGIEGASGQHVVSYVTRDRGKAWEGPFDIEPADGPEASWVMPLRVPATGRIYAFYTYNHENRREVRSVDGRVFHRADSLGSYAYRFSDDRGRTWSDERYEIPMRLFACDRENTYGGQVLFFWGVGKPFVHKGAAYVCASKVGGFGRGFFVQNEGVLFRSPNLLAEPDPSKHEWETLPEGEAGLRTPEGGGPIAGEFNATPMNDGSLYGTYRTIDGYACHACSRDDGRSWERDWMRYRPGGRKVKNPRAANFVRRFSNGKYLYWFHFHGGEVLGRDPHTPDGGGYEHRNPAWLCGGVEKDGRIHWSQPEIILYDDNPGLRMSYPDFIEDGGEFYVTETQKEIARVHRLDPVLLHGLWTQGECGNIATDALLLEQTAGEGGAALPELPTLHNHGTASVDVNTGATLREAAPREVEPRGGLSLETWVRFTDLSPWQILFDSRDEEGRGMRLQLDDRAALRLTLCGRIYGEPGGRRACGMTESTWACDYGLLKTGELHHVVFIVDGGPKIISVLVDGVLCDGGAERQYGWGRFHPALRDANGARRARIAPSLHGELPLLRLYGRYLRTSEAVANFRAGCVSVNRTKPAAK